MRSSAPKERYRAEGGQREESKRLRRSMGRTFAKTYMRYFSLMNRSDVG